MNDTVEIGPECFADGDETVISYKGANYYKACGAVVTVTRYGVATVCVKPVHHSLVNGHEDYDGVVKKEED